jgi:hypothetical protein
LTRKRSRALLHGAATDRNIPDDSLHFSNVPHLARAAQ